MSSTNLHGARAFPGWTRKLHAPSSSPSRTQWTSVSRFPSRAFPMPDDRPAPLVPAEPAADSDGLRTLTHILYALYGIFWLTGGVTALIAIIINYVKRDDVQGSRYASHFKWQIRSFWWSVGWTALG